MRRKADRILFPQPEEQLVAGWGQRNGFVRAIVVHGETSVSPRARAKTEIGLEHITERCRDGWPRYREVASRRRDAQPRNGLPRVNVTAAGHAHEFAAVRG